VKTSNIKRESFGRAIMSETFDRGSSSDDNARASIASPQHEMVQRLMAASGNDGELCKRRADSKFSCAVCLQTQQMLSAWGLTGRITQTALRHALCGRWDLLHSLEKSVLAKNPALILSKLAAANRAMDQHNARR
jgi:hypothetical protein